MAMKIASFLRCGVVIVLSLVSGRAEAQSDSVNLICWLRGADISFSVTTNWSNNSMGQSMAGETYGVDVPVNMIVGGEVPENDTVSYGSLSFAIDSSKTTVRNLTINYNPGGLGPLYSGYRAIYDSLPLTEVSFGNFVVSANLYRGDFTYWAVYQDFHSQGWVDYGQSGDSEYETDSVYLLLSSSNASVSPSFADSNMKQFLVAFTQDRNELSASFLAASFQRMLEIIDLLGRKAASYPVPSGFESLQLPNNLAPGCYFARLGDQVAKFVVPPR
jgi:hypothetical protein